MKAKRYDFNDNKKKITLYDFLLEKFELDPTVLQAIKPGRITKYTHRGGNRVKKPNRNKPKRSIHTKRNINRLTNRKKINRLTNCKKINRLTNCKKINRLTNRKKINRLSNRKKIRSKRT